VLINLVSNAIKFSDNGSVIISTSANGNEVVLSVKDQGIGIDQKNIPELFTPFKQFSASRDSREGSTGLGLSISKDIVEGHHGRIWAESEFGKGSVFSFTLPIS